MASFATLQCLHGSLQTSQFLGQDNYHFHLKQTSTAHHRKPVCRAEFNIVKMMGGRGLCNGEKGLQKELERKVDLEATAASSGKEELENSDGSEKLGDGVAVSKDDFEKEMMGLTGGFPGGEKGLIKFIEENPPQKGGLFFTDALKTEQVRCPDHDSTISNLLDRNEITVKPSK